MPVRAREFLSRLVENESLRPDLTRAARATAAFALPLVLAATVGLPVEPTFAAIAAQNVAMVDVRGAYRLRFALLLAMLLVLAGSVALGGLVAEHLPAALAATVFIALAGGLWRHVSTDYGPGLAVSSSLLFFISLAAPSGHAASHLAATLAGGALGLLLQVLLWPIRPQHPLRRAVAETWLAAADSFESMEPGLSEAASRIAESETALRTAINQAEKTLVHSGAAAAVVAPLSGLNLSAARLAVRVAAVRTALDSAPGQAARRRLAPALVPLFDTFAQLARDVALAVVSRQPSHLAACEIRLRRLAGLLGAVEARAAALGREEADAAQLPGLLLRIGELLEPLVAAVRATVARSGERAAFPLELLDLETWRLRPLAASIDLSPRLDPALVRFSLRLAVLTAGGVLAFKRLGLPHGYWLPFTIVVVLQPDYGSTRERAFLRVLGTLAGGLVAGAVLWFHPPPFLLLPLTFAGVFLFCYHVRRRYALAIFGVTIFVVLLMERAGGAGAAVAVERFAITLAGGLLALAAALLFWPAWERDRLPPLLAAAFRANRGYLHELSERLARGGGVDDGLVSAKRTAESANAAVFSSLRRLFADPKNRRDRMERFAALANGNQRLTRLANVLLVQLHPGEALVSASLPVATSALGGALEALAALTEERDESARTARLAPHALALDTLAFPPETDRSGWIANNLAQAATELRAMLAAA